MSVKLRIAFFAMLIVVANCKNPHPSKSKGNFDQDLYPSPTQNEDKNYWYEAGMEEIMKALDQPKPNTNIAKNVILFLGDGYGFPTIMASRIYKGQQSGFSGEEELLSFDNFPSIGLAKTYCVNSQVSDSASTGTAYLSGVKNNIGVVGYDCNVIRNQCQTMKDEHKVFSIAKWSQDAEKRTGFVTTTRVTHATPSNMYAHVADRDWEVDSKLPSNWQTDCPNITDIAAQLIDNQEGNNLNVIMGGGFQTMTPEDVATEDDPVSEYIAPREDGRYLCDEWLESKLTDDQRATLVKNKTSLLNIDANSVDYLMGIFANDHLQYENIIRQKELDVPTLKEMTEVAINVLNKSPNGYFLLVEGGKIDWAHHEGIGNTALDEAYAFDAAIQKALDLVDTEETLIVVTADHSHTMSVAGYPSRGTPIQGLADLGDDNIPYTTMLYGSGPGYKYTADDNEVVRPDPSQSDTIAFDYQQQSAVPRSMASHGGEDVPIYAKGPWAHLFYTVHEQNFIAKVMAYASCIGSDIDHCIAEP